MSPAARVWLPVLCGIGIVLAAGPESARAAEPAAAAAPASPNTLTAEELADGWILLFDGETLYGWAPTSEANWHVADGAIRVSEGPKGLLVTTSEFADYALRLEFRCPAATNSGVFLHTTGQPTDPARDCYELNIAAPDVSPFFTGSFVGRQKAREYVGGEGWHAFDVRLEGGRAQVAVDGRPVLDYTDPRPLGRGKIGLQLNSGPVEFRGVKLKPLGLAPLFNGRDLAGWRPFPEQKSVFTARPDGTVHVRDGRGQLESEAQFGDFALQIEVFSNGPQLNSGIFFRSIPGEFTNGYECQIQNGYKDGDRTQPVDCGTGGFYRRQNARRVMADDYTWFPLTLVVSGPHMAAWVNGVQVSDWTDTRPPHDNPRQGLRLAPGTLSLQGHDPTTDLSFRQLRAAELAPRRVEKE